MDTLREDAGVSCCFCNEGIYSSEVDPCDLNVLTNWDKEKSKQAHQTLWCHLDCLRSKIHPQVRQHLVVHLLSGQFDD